METKNVLVVLAGALVLSLIVSLAVVGNFKGIGYAVGDSVRVVILEGRGSIFTLDGIKHIISFKSVKEDKETAVINIDGQLFSLKNGNIIAIGNLELKLSSLSKIRFFNKWKAILDIKEIEVKSKVIMLSKDTNKFNLGDNANEFYPSIDGDELNTVLASGIYTNHDNDEFEFDQKIELGTLNGLQYFRDSDFNNGNPLIGFKLSGGNHILNYTLDFRNKVNGGNNLVNIENMYITILGKKYYIIDVGTTATNPQITLLDSTKSATISEGQTTTLIVGDKTYEVFASFIGDNDAVLVVNGENLGTLEDGQTKKLKSGDYIGIKDILFQEYAGGKRMVDFSIGAGKIKIQNNAEIELNNEDISGITNQIIKGYINTGSSNNVESIVLEWNVDDELFIAPGTDLVMPVFETIKLSMEGFITPSREFTTIQNNGDDNVELKTTVTDGSVTLPFLYTNTKGIIGIGKDADEQLITNIKGSTNERIVTFNMNKDSYFVASWISRIDSESYVLEVNGITTDTATIRSLASGKEIQLGIGETKSLGRLNFTLVYVRQSPNKIANIKITSAGVRGNVYLDKLVTKDGLTIQLPYNSISTGNGVLNLTAKTIPIWIMSLTEETKDGYINSGESFTVTIGLNSNGEIQVSDVSTTEYEIEDSSNFISYQVSDLATKLLRYDRDQDIVEITYTGKESYAEVYISEVIS